MTTPSPPPTGQEGKPAIPNQTLYRRIGRGSYGEVWLATDVMQKWRAVKIVARKEEDRACSGYQREFKALDRYEEVCHLHGSLMPILAVGRDPADRFFYYSMELADDARTNQRLETSNGTPEQVASMVDGYRPRTLRSELQARGRLPPAECVELGIALATALEQLHKHGLIHRDIKPENIIFVHGLPKLADNAGGCFGAHGERLAFAAGTQACLFDLATGNTLQRWRLADGFEDQLLSGWFFPHRTGVEPAIPLGPGWRGCGWACAFSPNGRLLARGTEEGAVLVADLPEVVRRLSSLR